MANPNHPELQNIAPNLPPQPNPVGPIGVADPARNLVAERNQEAQIDRQIALTRRPRFEAHRLTPAIRQRTDDHLETLIFQTAMNFPMIKTIFPRVSTFIPCFSTALHYLNFMDTLMASTKRWTDNCMGWVPPCSQIYCSVLFIIQTMRAMESSGMLSPGSDISLILREFTMQYPIETLWIPGPLVPLFKNLACFRPTASDRFGNVTPALPTYPGWTRENKYKYNGQAALRIPNICFFISRLRSICAASTRPNTNEQLFQNDVDGPRYMATVYGHNCNHDEIEQAAITSPGAYLNYAGTLRMWQDAAAHLDINGTPACYDSEVDNITDSWADALLMTEDEAWFGQYASMMAKYCQFWKSSCPLSDCSPNCSAAGAVRCIPSDASTVFDTPDWNAQTGTHNNTQHRHANQVGHYSMIHNLHLRFKALCAIEDIPEAHIYAANTYNINLASDALDPATHMRGDFWTIAPDAYTKNNITVFQGVIATIAHDYHSDGRINSELQ